MFSKGTILAKVIEKAYNCQFSIEVKWDMEMLKNKAREGVARPLVKLPMRISWLGFLSLVTPRPGTPNMKKYRHALAC